MEQDCESDYDQTEMKDLRAIVDGIRKPRSLTSKDDSWGYGSRYVDVKHFRVNGADPRDLPSQGTVHRKDRSRCKRSPDHRHHYEIVVERAYRDFETMVDQCAHCGKKKGFGFRVWTKPKPEWFKKMEARWKR